MLPSNQQHGSTTLPLVTLEQFKVLMDTALARSRGVPRNYLLPAPQQRIEEQPSFKPSIAQKSKVHHDHC